jgi:SAM-dependent methyltransferase
MSDDKRSNIYHNLHAKQLVLEEADTRHSASQILTMLGQYVTPKSLLDVGCGLGVWLKVAMDLGMNDVLGLEGPWIEGSELAVPAERIMRLDLERPFSLGRRFDVVICSEVAEHLPESAAGGLIDSLVAHGNYILFSAAIPHQGGHHHVNEQFLTYWIDHFARHDYVVLDLFRARIWTDRSIFWWLRQNLVLFVRRSVAEANPTLRDELKVERPVAIIHPIVYLQRLGIARQQAPLIDLLKQGGVFEVTKTGDEEIKIVRIR